MSRRDAMRVCQALENDWVVRREEIQLTGPTAWEGGLGHSYRGYVQGDTSSSQDNSQLHLVSSQLATLPTRDEHGC